MKKFIPYITAALILVLSIVLQVSLGKGFDGWHLAFGVAVIIALLMFAAAWKIGQDPDKPLYQAVLLSLVGLSSPIVAQLLAYGFDDCEFKAVVQLSLLLFPFVHAGVIGIFTRKINCPNAVRAFLNGLPGILFVGVVLADYMKDLSSLSSFLISLPLLVLICLILFLSAYAETQVDPAKRREFRWNSWKASLVLVILIGVKAFLDYVNYGFCSYHVFNTLLCVTLPLVLWRWKKWVIRREYSHNVQVFLYFGGAFLLILLPAGGLDYLMLPAGGIRYMISTEYLFVDCEWMFIGTVVALFVYWWKQGKYSVAALAGSIVLLLGNFDLLFAANNRLRQVLYDLGGPAINIKLSERADWLGYHIDALKAYVSGDFSSLYNLYADTANEGFMETVGNISAPYVFPLTLVLFLLVVVTTLLMVKFAQDRDMAIVLAISMILQGFICLIESVLLFSEGIGFPFTGLFIADFILLKWMLGPKVTNRIELSKDADAPETVSG